MAAAAGHEAVVEVLLERGADVAKRLDTVVGKDNTLW